MDSIDRFHRNERGWDGCGYHFVVGNGSESGDGEVEVSQRWLAQKHGAHTKVSGHPEYNEQGIGICLVGDFNRHRPTLKQIQATRDLIAYLQARFGIPDHRVTTHRELAGDRTACPGRYFPESEILPR
jgi:N-acetyl-anhydromuramyl-L-alanine amidase AmpD